MTVTTGQHHPRPADLAWAVDDSGLLAGAEYRASPNCDERPAGTEPEVLVVHAISLPPGRFGTGHVEQLFLNQLDWSAHPYFETIRGLEVSAHLLIRRDGSVVQFVPFGQRAWHAGVSCCEGRERVNDFSIGIELEGSDDVAFTDQQYAVLTGVTGALLRHYPKLSGDRIYGHSDIAPGRKTDPGPRFDWERYRDLLARA